MNTKHIIWIASILISLVVALVFSTFDQPIVSAQDLSTASISLQATSTPITQGVSEIGSTDGIFIMGIVIVLIVTIPVLFYRNKI